jgi:hypothetical protein
MGRVRLQMLLLLVSCIVFVYRVLVSKWSGGGMLCERESDDLRVKVVV